jgi:hypothetical protein
VARAADGPSLRWSAPAECPAETQLRAEIDRLVARPGSPSRAMAEVAAEVTRDAGGPYRLRLVITDRDGGIRERRVDGATCAEVAGAAAVILALASDDDAPPPVDPPSPPIEPPAPRRDPAPPPAEIAPATPPDLLPRIWDLAALGGVDFASLPAPAPGFGVGVALGVGRNRFELRAMAWLPERATLTSLADVGGDVALYAGTLRYCRSLVHGTIDLAPCAGFEAGALVASGVGVATPTSGAGPWLAPELALAGTALLGRRFALALDLDGLAILARDRFVITRGGQVFQPPKGTARAVLGLRVRFE